jgi:hypothetical protein
VSSLSQHKTSTRLQTIFLTQKRLPDQIKVHVPIAGLIDIALANGCSHAGCEKIIPNVFGSRLLTATLSVKSITKIGAFLLGDATKVKMVGGALGWEVAECIQIIMFFTGAAVAPLSMNSDRDHLVGMARSWLQGLDSIAPAVVLKLPVRLLRFRRLNTVYLCLHHQNPSSRLFPVLVSGTHSHPPVELNVLSQIMVYGNILGRCPYRVLDGLWKSVVDLERALGGFLCFGNDVGYG